MAPGCAYMIILLCVYLQPFWSFVNYHHNILLGSYLFEDLQASVILICTSTLSSLTNCVHQQIIRGTIYYLNIMYHKTGMLSGLLMFDSKCVDLRGLTYKLFTEYICWNCSAIIYFTLKVCIYFVNVSRCC